MRALRTLLSVTVVMAGLSFLAPSFSYANGRFPIADQLVVDPKDPNHIALRTTYGVLQSADAGDTWGWVCEGAVGYGGTQDPAIGIMADGTVLAGVFEGLSITHDRGCTWTFVGAPLTGEYVIDVSVHRDEPSRAVAITSTGMGSGFNVVLAETNDNGATWAQAGVAINNDMIALTVDVAPSITDRVYVSGIVGQDYAPAIERSDDRGATWTRTYLDASFAADVPFLAAIDPTNPDRVYLRLSGSDNDRLLVSDDGAKTFTEVFVTTGDLLGFALSPDGSRVAIGSISDGVQIANTTDLAFTQVNKVQTRCLTWTVDGLYVCANEFVDQFTVGFSKDEGKNFTGIYKLAEICPAACPVGAQTNNICASAWGPLAATLGVDQSACSTGNTTTPPPLGPGGGCSCSTEESSGQTMSGLLVAGLLAAFVRHKRRRSAC